MSVYLEHADGSVELIRPDLSEGELIKLREELDAKVPAVVITPVQPTQTKGEV